MSCNPDLVHGIGKEKLRKKTFEKKIGRKGYVWPMCPIFQPFIGLTCWPLLVIFDDPGRPLLSLFGDQDPFQAYSWPIVGPSSPSYLAHFLGLFLLKALLQSPSWTATKSNHHRLPCIISGLHRRLLPSPTGRKTIYILFKLIKLSEFSTLLFDYLIYILYSLTTFSVQIMITGIVNIIKNKSENVIVKTLTCGCKLQTKPYNSCMFLSLLPSLIICVYFYYYAI